MNLRGWPPTVIVTFEVLLAVELVGPHRLQSGNGLVDARLHLGKAVVLVGQARQIGAGDPQRPERVVAHLPDLALQREHVGVEPQIEHHVRVPFLLGRMRLGLLQDVLEAAEQLQAHGHEAGIHRKSHEFSPQMAMAG